jgi:hypothetical protein
VDAALGSIRIAAGTLPTLTVDHLSFRPTRLAFRAATTSATGRTDLCVALDSETAPPVGQVYQADSIQALKTYTYVATLRVVKLYDRLAPLTSIEIKLISRQDDGFTVQVLVNTLTEDLILQWIAADGDGVILEGLIPAIDFS